MLSNDGYARNTYERIYKVVAKANNLINFDINKLDNAAANQVEANYYVGQAYALRALGFFDVRLYGQKYSGGDTGIVLPLKLILLRSREGLVLQMLKNRLRVILIMHCKK